MQTKVLLYGWLITAIMVCLIVLWQLEVEEEKLFFCMGVCLLFAPSRVCTATLAHVPKMRQCWRILTSRRLISFSPYRYVFEIRSQWQLSSILFTNSSWQRIYRYPPRSSSTFLIPSLRSLAHSVYLSLSHLFVLSSANFFFSSSVMFIRFYVFRSF